MINLKNVWALILIALISTPSSALVIQNASLEWDAGDRLMAISGDITSSSNSITDIWFDWDNGLQNYDFSTYSLLSSNIGGSFQAGYLSLPGGIFAVTGINGAPQAAPLSFSFLFQIGGASNLFATELMDIGVSGPGVTTNAGFGDQAQDVFTPVAADLTSPVPTPATLAIFVLGLAGLGYFRRKKV